VFFSPDGRGSQRKANPCPSLIRKQTRPDLLNEQAATCGHGALHSQYPHNFARTSTEMSGIFTQEPVGGSSRETRFTECNSFLHDGGHAAHNKGFVKGIRCCACYVCGQATDLFGGESLTASLIPIERDVRDSPPSFGCRPHSCGDLRWFSSRL